MKKWGLVFDSSIGEKKETIEKAGDFFVPFFIKYGESEKRDGIEISAEEVKEKIDKGIIGKTSVPSIVEIEKVFDEGLKKCEKLICINISSKLSGMQNAFKLAASKPKYKNKVNVLEYGYWHTPYSTNIFSVLSSKEARNLSYDSVLKLLKDYSNNFCAILALKDIKFLAASGRLSKPQAVIGNLIKIVPALIYSNGIIDPKKTIKARSAKKAIEKGTLEILNYAKLNKLKLNDFYIGVSVVQKGENIEEIIELIKRKSNNKIEVRKESQNILYGVSVVHVGHDVNVFSLYKKINLNDYK